MSTRFKITIVIKTLIKVIECVILVTMPEVTHVHILLTGRIFAEWMNFEVPRPVTMSKQKKNWNYKENCKEMWTDRG